MIINRTYKFKCNFSKEQTNKFKDLIEQSSLIYNFFLYFNTKRIKQNKKILTPNEMFKYIPKLKAKFPTLASVSNDSFSSIIFTHYSDIKNALNNNKNLNELKISFRNETFSYSKKKFINFTDSIVFLPEIGEVKFISSRNNNLTFRSFSLFRKFDKYFLLVTVSIEIKDEIIEPKKFIGIDVGLKEFAILSNGKSINNPRFYRELENKLKFEQRKLSRKQKGSKNWEKQLKKVQNVHEEIINSRINFLHKLSNFLVSNYDVIGIEKLNIQSMVKNKKFSKSILDAGWGTFIKFLKYKAKENNKLVIEVGRFFPSSQICSNCGSKQFMPVHLRTYECKSCYEKIDRDYNAAKNIENKVREMVKAKI